MAAAPAEFLTDLAERYALGTLRESQLADAGIAALEKGYDSPHLRMLAGWTDQSTLDPRRLFVAALEEHDITPLNYDEAKLRQLARLLPTLRAFLDNHLHISRLADTLRDRASEFLNSTGGTFYHLYIYADDWHDHDDPALKQIFENCARDEAIRLCRSINPASPISPRPSAPGPPSSAPYETGSPTPSAPPPSRSR